MILQSHQNKRNKVSIIFVFTIDNLLTVIYCREVMKGILKQRQEEMREREWQKASPCWKSDGKKKRLKYGRRTRSRLKFTTKAKAKFWSQVHKGDNCWLWIGPLAARGYGHFSFGDLQIMAHRYSWELANFEISASRYYVHHLCKNHDCVRPDHLELVTPDEHGKRHRKYR